MMKEKTIRTKTARIITAIGLVCWITTGCTDNNNQDASRKNKSYQITATQDNENIHYKGETYQIIHVDGGDRAGTRQPNVAVDIGYGDRAYWALTNEYGQLVTVIAEKIILQDENQEPVNSEGRYYDDEANVSGTEQNDLDQGHVIADSLGGVSNAYNITPQNSILNRHGNQAYMEKIIRDAGGCENFIATITYAESTTQIPSKYIYRYTLKGKVIVDEFENVNPDHANKSMESRANHNSANRVDANAPNDVKKELERIDTNKNGEITIAEARAAGFAMPIHSQHWLYQYMTDADSDGMIGE